MRSYNANDGAALFMENYETLKNIINFAIPCMYPRIVQKWVKKLIKLWKNKLRLTEKKGIAGTKASEKGTKNEEKPNIEIIYCTLLIIIVIVSNL